MPIKQYKQIKAAMEARRLDGRHDVFDYCMCLLFECVVANASLINFCKVLMSRHLKAYIQHW